MSVMNAGKKSKALVRPLRAGNSRAGERPGRIRASEPGAAASRPEKRNVPGVSAPARPDKAVPGRPRATGKSPARPRLWAVPDVSRPAIAGSGGRDPGATSARDTSASAKTGPGQSPGQRGVGRGWAARRAAPVARGRKYPAGAPAPDGPRRPDLTSSHGAQGPHGVARAAAAWRPGSGEQPDSRPAGPAARPPSVGAARTAAAGRLLPGARGPVRLRSLSQASRAYPADQAHPAGPPGPLGGRDSPPRGGHHPAPARRGLRRSGLQPRPAAVRGPGGHAAGSGQARPVPVVGRAERGAQGRPAGGHPADHGVQRAGQPGRGARREPLGPPGLTWRRGTAVTITGVGHAGATRRRETRERSPELISPPGRRALDLRRGGAPEGERVPDPGATRPGAISRTGCCGRDLGRNVPGAPGGSRPACATRRQGFSWPSPAGRRRFTGKSRNRRVAACAAPGVCSSVTTTSSSYSAVVHV